MQHDLWYCQSGRCLFFLAEHTNVREYAAALDGYQILKPDLLSKHIS